MIIERLAWLDRHDFVAVKGQRNSRLSAGKREVQLAVIAVILSQTRTVAFAQKEPKLILIEISPCLADQVLRQLLAFHCALVVSRPLACFGLT